jgi:murein DD-endopeptidase MepM/ murein hydrolase activator NlpD
MSRTGHESSQFIDTDAPSKVAAFVTLGLLFDATGTVWNLGVAWPMIGTNDSYSGPVLAVADAIVVASRNDLPDQVPGKLPDGLPIDEADGNFAILDIGGGAYALYAHMQPGSVRVSAGDRVRRGDQIGTVGNSGNSQAPHLHLQMMNAPSGLAANGVPYVFDAFSVTAVDEAGTADFDRAEATGSPLTLTLRVPPTYSEKVLPLDLSIVDWGN